MFKYFLVTTYSLECFSIDFCQKQSQLGSVANQNKGENREGSLTSQKKNNQTVRGIGKRERESFNIWLLGRVTRIFSTNHRVKRSKTNEIPDYWQGSVRNCSIIFTFDRSLVRSIGTRTHISLLDLSRWRNENKWWLLINDLQHRLWWDRNYLVELFTYILLSKGRRKNVEHCLSVSFSFKGREGVSDLDQQRHSMTVLFLCLSLLGRSW